MANEVLSPASSPINSSPVPNEENLCRNCEKQLRQPKVLNCLHVFCQECLQSTVDEVHNSTGTIPDIISCSVCSQETRLSAKGIEGLPSDDVLSGMLEVDLTDDDDPIVCTSCKAKEKAIARCSDCANFLCPHCVSAHQYMRCFEDHKVISFEDMQNGDGPKFLKPMFCQIHPSENVKYFCLSCQEVVCNDCIAEDHQQPEHFTEKISNVDTKLTEEINTLVTESKNKVKQFEETSNGLENALSEMQMQRDNVKGLVQETFQSYKATLEKRRDEILKDLEEIHAAQEMSIIEMCHNVGKKIEKIEDGCKFAEHILKNGNSYQILMLHKVIVNQLMYLFNSNSKPDLNRTIEFKTDDMIFTEAIRKTFGSIRLINANDPKAGNTISSLHSSFETEGFNLPSGVLSPELPQVSTAEFSNIHAVTPVPITGGSHFNSLHMSPVDASPIGVAITGAHNIPENCLSRSSHSPAMSDSGISVDAASTNSAPSAPLYDMTKLGRGQLSLNDHIVSGLNLTVNGLTAPGSRTETPVSQTDSTLANLLSPTATTSPLPSTNLTNIDTLVGFLNQVPSPTMINNLGNLGSLSGLGNMGIMNSLTNINSTSTSGTVSSTSSGSNNNLSANISPPYPPIRRSNKMSPMQIRCKFGQLGPGKGQFNSPHGFCLGIEEDIIVADTNNHRIQVFEKNGEFKYQFGIPGRDEGQLWYPRKVAVMRNSGKYVVCDRGNERSRMQIFTKNGHFIRKIAIRYIDIVAGLAITQQGHIVAVDSVSPTVFCIAETGDLIKWFDCSDFMREPSDIAISGKEYFVCDFKGHCVVVFNEEGQFLRRIGCESITNYPNGIDISDAGDVLVGDSHGNRFHVAVFQSDGSLIGEFECPYVKVSRCCGLNITSEGYIVTLAKNNHHVLVLDTLYIT
ncbi:brain tumor protein-like [Argonauta hians]